MNQVTGTARPGGRTARTREVVHTAVREMLRQANGAAPTIPGVAAQSGVNAATIYRRWRSAEALVLDVAVADLIKQEPIMVTGDLRADLLTWGTSVAAGVSRPEGLGFLRAILAATANPIVGLEGARELVGPRLAQFQAVLDGSTTPELTPTDIVDLMLAPVYLAAMFGQPLDPEHIPRLVDNIIAVRDNRRTAPTKQETM